MRLLLIRILDDATVTYMALDENNDSLEENLVGIRMDYDELFKKMNSFVHRFCIDVIVPVSNHWGHGLVYGLRMDKYADRVYKKGDYYGWWVTPEFMNLIPHDESVNSKFTNEEILRKIAGHVRIESAVVQESIPVVS